ncbi:MAG: methylated-DNA--[protein]-cysteine S-methyltransferase [Agitococcus sp.]|nr:methylated-DNA--[protein]-cysteine S-methyltransferase [Agitococcus sp.]
MPSHYQRIATAIDYIQTNFQAQPTLDDIAQHVHLSPYHFQRLFSEWAGTSPKKFLQYISLTHAKNLLKNQASLLETAIDTGLSGASRLHDLFITIEGMTPAEYKNGGAQLTIFYSFEHTLFGEVLVASTDKGICHLAFYDDEVLALSELSHKFPNACYQQQQDSIQQTALALFKHDWHDSTDIKLHLKGSEFQLKVWESLLKIPLGQLSSYGDIAAQIDNPKAARAVGSAIGDNPVAFLIPCHRVIQASGALGGYHWGITRKMAMIAWEMAQTEPQSKVMV